MALYTLTIASHQLAYYRYRVGSRRQECDPTGLPRLREVLNIEGASLQSVTTARNKLEMKAAVQTRNLRVPGFMSLERYMAQQGQVPWSGATVLKPQSGASSMDVRIYKQPARAFDEVRHRTSPPSVASSPT
jgi:hypothetical protein